MKILRFIQVDLKTNRTVKNNKKPLFHFESFGQYKMRVDIGIFKHLSEMTHPNIYTAYIQYGEYAVV